jgi:endonuclease/exonuclease/phosphatase family metal-dependent hydrolase
MRNRQTYDDRRWLTAARVSIPVLFALLLALTAAAQNRPVVPSLQGQGTLEVMTYNMYVGTEYTGAVTAPDLPAFFQVMTNAFNDVQDGDPAGRAQAIAQQIAAVEPDLVSLQEVSTWSTGTYTGTWSGTTTCENLNLEFDYRQLLLDALAAQGAHYMPVATNTHFTVDAPTSEAACVRNTWSVVILAHSDLKPEDFSYTNVQTATFANVLNIPVAALGYLISWPRGWASIDVHYRDKQFRFIAAHLDNVGFFNDLQGPELIGGPADTTLPVVVAGDMNSPDPNPLTYENFLTSGFTDAWTAARHLFDSGYSGNTKAYPSPMDERGDLVLVRGRFNVQSAAVLCGGSDHCGVVARLQLPSEE